MPVERVETPLPTNENMKRCSDHYESAKKFVAMLTEYIVNSNDIYKLFMFIYLTLMILFVFVVDSESYKINHIGTEIFGLIVMIELALGAVSICAIIGILNNHALFLAPLLFIHVCVLIYGFFHYVCPFVLLKQSEAIFLIEETGDNYYTMQVCAQLALLIVVRMAPFFLQTLFIGFVIRIIFSLMLVKNVESKHFLPNRNTTNTHVWSSIRRKISARQVLDSATQTPQSRILPDPDLVCEMSAKFRNEKFPNSQLV